MLNPFPLITNLSKVLPATFTHKVAVPEAIFSPPNALRLVRHVGGLHPHFPTYPYQFTIPGCTLYKAESFGKLMSTIVRWNKNQRTPKKAKSGVPKPEETKYVPRLNFFKLEFTCPCKGQANLPLNSRKSTHISA
jgi:hypothetical protein